MNKKYVNKYVLSFMSLPILATLAIAAPAMADDNNTPQANPSSWGAGMGGQRPMMRPGVFGTVSAVSGNIITVSGKQGFGPNATSATFTVDATNAKIMKNNAAATISDIAVGDMIAAEGTLNGTNLVATMIHDGKMPMRGPKNGEKTGTPPAPAFTGNGQPVVAGTVSAVSGSTLTLTNKSNVTYTVDTSSAKITQGPNTINVSNVVVGDMVVVQGTFNGNSVTASTVIDQNKPATPGTSTNPGQHKGFLGGIGSFFSHLFGF